MSQNQNCTFIIVRHGETDWNIEHKIQGHSDNPLNENGRKQAKELAKRLENIHFDKILSSDLIRAKETAEVVALQKKLAIETTELLRERRWGEWEGKSSQLIHQANKDIEHLDKIARLQYRYAESIETDEELNTRFVRLLREVAIANPGKTILIVAHGGVIITFLYYLDFELEFPVKVENAASITIESDGVDFKILDTFGIGKREA